MGVKNFFQKTFGGMKKSRTFAVLEISWIVISEYIIKK